MTDLAFRPAKRMAAMIRRKKIGCLELLDHILARVDAFNPAINAVVVTDVERARRRARAADRALAKGDAWGPFHGIPMTVKEAFHVKGMPTTWGLPEYAGNIATRNAAVVDRWLAAGAVIFGKTNVPAWVADGQSFNSIYGTTNNPWDLARTPGGSSGGAAAAVAAGLTAIETGSDIACSIRAPAHMCGIFGHKPTFGLCPARGHALTDRMSPDDLNSIGPLARSADDLEAALGVLAGPDAIEAAGLRYTLPPARKAELREFKIGVILNDAHNEVESCVLTVLQHLADSLARRKVKIDDRARPDIDMGELRRVFAVMLRAATSHRQTDAQFADNLAAAQALETGDDSANACVLRGTTLHHRDWLALDELRTRWRWVWHEWFKSYDLLLAPAYAMAAHPHAQQMPLFSRTYLINGKPQPHANQTFWAGLSSLVYLPTTAAPAGFTSEGLPVGVQIIGPHFADRTTIHFARLIEREIQGFVAPPGYASSSGESD